jgi:hypothetical protein
LTERKKKLQAVLFPIFCQIGFERWAVLVFDISACSHLWTSAPFWNADAMRHAMRSIDEP